jgi:hypothetical protein
LASDFDRVISVKTWWSCNSPGLNLARSTSSSLADGLLRPWLVPRVSHRREEIAEGSVGRRTRSNSPSRISALLVWHLPTVAQLNRVRYSRC